MLRKAACVVLGEDQGFIGSDIEDPVSALDQLGLNSRGFLNRDHQTGGLG